jgi:hypothetical protein
MKLYTILVRNSMDETAWVITAWDEYSVDENNEGWQQAIADARENYFEMRISVVNVPNDFLEKPFMTPEVDGEVAS